jgi:hypothetical protein
MKDLTENQERFVELVSSGMSATKAAEAAGYSKASARQIGSQLLQKDHVQAAIRKENVRRMNLLGGKALAVLDEIMSDPLQPAGARVTAAIALAERAGLHYSIEERRLSNVGIPITQMSREQLIEFAAAGAARIVELKKMRENERNT